MGTSGGGGGGGGGGQRFCLRWNNHQSNLLSVFDQLLHDEAFVDVTLAVDGRLLRAHKMVLSACSPYFQSLFVGHPDRHPIVILKDVPYADMRSLLDFMYRGEVSVDQERLTAFLKVAESLRIKGLTEVNEERCDLPSIASSLLSSAPAVPPPPPNLHRIHPSHLAQAHKRALPPMAANPLLGSALTAPKRKRGRPRKLSGGSNDPPPMANAHDLNEHEMRLMHPDRSDSPGMGPPDLLEVNMGEGEDHPHPVPHPLPHAHPHHQQQQQQQQQPHHQLDHNDLDAASLLEAADDSDSVDHTGVGTDDEVEEVDEKPPPPAATGIKQEPTPGTSTAQENDFQGNGPNKEGDSYMPDKDKLLEQGMRLLQEIKSENVKTDEAFPPPSDLDECYEDMIACSPASSSDEGDGEGEGESNARPKAEELLDDDISQFELDSFKSMMAVAAPPPLPQGKPLDKASVRRYCTHEADNAYRCNVCGKTYTHISNFCRHFLSTHHGMRPEIPCPVCFKLFTRKDNMMTHTKQVHRLTLHRGTLQPIADPPPLPPSVAPTTAAVDQPAFPENI